MMFLSRNTILTTVLLATTAVVETQAEACSDIDESTPGCGVGLYCTFLQSCIVNNCQYNCDVLTSGMVPGDGKTEVQSGVFQAGKIVPVQIYKANNETEVDGVAQDALNMTGGGNSAGVASYVLLAVGAAAIIAGL